MKCRFIFVHTVLIILKADRMEMSVLKPGEISNNLPWLYVPLHRNRARASLL